MSFTITGATLANMARLKLNEIVIWNDYAPLNAAEVVACAHDLGIRVIWGYAWGWDTKIDVHLSDETLLARLADEAVERFEREYAALPGDGIYFQSFTETTEQELDGRSIADVVVPWVNGICARILEKRPNLELQFGLHATSVAQKLDRIAQIDPRVRIVWEDCGAFPYAYLAENVAHARGDRGFYPQVFAPSRAWRHRRGDQGHDLPGLGPTSYTGRGPNASANATPGKSPHASPSRAQGHAPYAELLDAKRGSPAKHCKPAFCRETRNARSSR